MAYVYRYTDIEDGIIKYVGIIWGKNRTIKQRVYEHSIKDTWCQNKTWKIEYFYTRNRTDAETYESHFIALYKTYKYYNDRKSDWGESELINNQDINWVLYSENDFCESIGGDYIYDVALTKNFDFDIKPVKVIKSTCKITGHEHLYCKNCASNDLYKKDNGTKYGMIHCCSCDSWVAQGNKTLSELYTPFFTGEYKKDENGNNIIRNNYIICFGKKQNWSYCSEEYLRDCHQFTHGGSPSRYDSYKENRVITYTYALSEDDIDEQKKKLTRYTKQVLENEATDKVNELKIIRETTIYKLQNEIKERKMSLQKFCNTYKQMLYI